MLTLKVKSLASDSDGSDQHGFARAEEISGITGPGLLAVIAGNRCNIEYSGSEVIYGPAVLMGDIPYHG
jgi:hypothetical protein